MHHTAKFPILGIPEIDEEHTQLFAILEQLEDAVDVKKDAALSKQILDEFFLQLDMHCASEEAFMAKIDYPRLEQHRHFHPEGSGQLIIEKKRTIKDVLWVNIYSLECLLSSHIFAADLHYVPHYLEWIKTNHK